MATFSERFRELRKEKGMSQRELAAALHMSNSAVAMYVARTAYYSRLES